MTVGQQPVLILGAGINGCALARELTLNGQGVWIVDTADIAAGATSGSSRLIHGGLRYLEYGDFELVKESLAERARLLRLAPQFVRPLELFIPSENRTGGALAAIGRFFDLRRWPSSKRSRGQWLIRAGLTLYDAYAQDPCLPKHRTLRAADRDVPPVDRHKYRWVSAYYDAQVQYPERLSLAMLADAAQLAESVSVDFRVLNHHTARRHGATVEIAPNHGADETLRLEPPMIVNATGAWVDETLARLEVPAAKLMGGTLGSHVFTFNDNLRALLGTRGIYAEAGDGRPIFITPLADCVLIGTTDKPFDGSPDDARTSDAEIDYLIDSVNQIVSGARLERNDIAFHYCAVRPLPRSDASTPGAITRRHAVVKSVVDGMPVISLVGGKLTTMRSLAESAAAEVLAHIGRPVVATSQQRPLPGAENFPPTPATADQEIASVAAQFGYPLTSVRLVWQLLGTRTRAVLSGDGDRSLLADSELPTAMGRWSIHHEWAHTLADLVERRLMLLYHQRLTRACLHRLAELLVESGHLAAPETEIAVDRETARLQARYCKRVD